MKDIPAKLEKYLATLDNEKRKRQHDLFLTIYDRAKTANIQNARHWTMRQVISERSLKEIDKRFARVSRNKDNQKR